MKTVKGMVTTALMCGALVSVPAWAEEEAGDQAGGAPEGKKGQGWFAQMDADQDGKVTLEEFKTFHTKNLDKKFKAKDKNGDGVLTQDEMGGQRDWKEQPGWKKDKQHKGKKAPAEADKPADAATE